MLANSTVLNLQDSRTSRKEVTSIVVGVETNKVTAQCASEEVLTVGEDPVDFAAWEWCVEEESHLDILDRVLHLLNLFSEILGQQHKMVVVNPNSVSILDCSHNSLCERPIGLLVCIPERLVEADFGWVVMEERPQYRIYAAVRYASFWTGNKVSYSKSHCLGHMSVSTQMLGFYRLLTMLVHQIIG